MEDKQLPKSIGNSTATSVPYPYEEEICKRLDEFYVSIGIEPDVQPSSLFRGALFAMRHKSNPDWIAQTAHSLREIIYQFTDRYSIKITDALTRHGTARKIKPKNDEVQIYYGLINDIAHHNFTKAAANHLIGGTGNNPVEITPGVFERLVSDFGKVLRIALLRQTDVIKSISQMLKSECVSANLEEVVELIELNFNSREYFYAQANERWLSWLWENGFLDVIKDKAEDLSKYSYSTPELSYLVRAANNDPEKVADIILDVIISVDNFNPEVVDRFTHICSTLPAQQLTRVVHKIRNEGWVPLMGQFNRWPFEYEKMLKTLVEAGDYESAFVLGEAVLSVRPKEQIEKTKYSKDSPFYFDHLSSCKVFDHLSSIKGEAREGTLAVLVDTFHKIMLLVGKEEEEKVFEFADGYYLYDVDFFDLKLEPENITGRDDVKTLAATIKKLVVDLLGEKCADLTKARGLYDRHFFKLPDSFPVWRIRLFVFSLCPDVFKNELKQAFFRIFEETGRYLDLACPEYYKVLKICFTVLPESDQREYVNKVFEYFRKQAHDDREDEKWHKEYGWRVLSSIYKHLLDEDLSRAHAEFGKVLDPNFESKPAFGGIRGGSVHPRGPITLDEFNRLSIFDIAKQLRGKWSPEELKKQNTSEDFLRPLNAEGTSDLLRGDIPKRFQNYIGSSMLFFERGVLDEHYTHSFLWGVQEYIRNNREDAKDVVYEELVKLFEAIVSSGKTQAFNRDKREVSTYDGWLCNWTDVHNTMASAVRELIGEEAGCTALNFLQYRDRIFPILEHLLEYPDPEHKDEVIETAKWKTKKAGRDEYMVGDPFTTAINTVRGRAFEAFALFVYQDGKQFDKEDKIKISRDVKALYEKMAINEKTCALMFMFGHHLPTFYYRDVEWFKGLVPTIFPSDSSKHDLYLAAWEGYLTNPLYEELFFDPTIQNLYSRAITLSPDNYTKREYYTGLDEGLATHLALAFIHYKDASFDSHLFKEFWANNKKDESNAQFVSFLGRRFVSGDNASVDEFLRKDPQGKQRLKEFWGWMLKQHDDDPVKNIKPLTYFGFWINLKKDTFEVEWLAKMVKGTLEKTNGLIEWEYGLMDNIEALAKSAPVETIKILHLLYLECGVRSGRLRVPFSVNIDAFRMLYHNDDTREDTRRLIDDLLREGGSPFWELEGLVE